MSAPAFDPLDTANTLDGMAEAARRLMHDFGVTITWSTLDDDHIQFDGDARTVVINKDSPIADQCCAIVDCWRLCAIGPDAAPDMIPTSPVPQLRVVR